MNIEGRDKRKEVDPLLAWSIIVGLILFFVGGVIFSNHSRLIGGLLMGLPATLFIVSLLRTPREQWRQLGKAVARIERERESRPKTGIFWMVFHRVGSLLAILFIIVIVASYAISWFG